MIVSYNAPVINEDGTATISGSFSDVGSLDTHTVTISWGDGTTSSASVDPVARTFTANHQYLDDALSAAASDVYRSASRSPMMIRFSLGCDHGDSEQRSPRYRELQRSGHQRRRYGNYQRSFSDVGSLDTHTVTISWGDGTTSSATVDPVARTFTANHQYLDTLSLGGRK